MSNLPRKPVRFIAENQELLKSMSDMMPTPMTDYKVNVDAPEAKMESAYRSPDGRVNGNELFRRYPDGTLDLDAAKHVVVDIINRVRDHGILTELEKVALTCIFPMMFSFVDARLIGPLTAVQLRLSADEILAIHRAVTQHMITMTNWNAGMGGSFKDGTYVPKV